MLNRSEPPHSVKLSSAVQTLRETIPNKGGLIDQHQRPISYARLSITELCNFRCSYCLPHGFGKKSKLSKELSVAEYRVLIAALAEIGIKKIRITGGEPVLRPDLLEILRVVQQSPVEQLYISTNGYRLKDFLAEWDECEVKGFNVSIDSLDPDKFAALTGHALLPAIITAIDKALTHYRFKIKINAVLMQGQERQQLKHALAFIRDREVDLRFIELMRTHSNSEVFASDHVRADGVAAQLINDGWTSVHSDATAGPAQCYEHKDYRGRIGLIRPYQDHFCERCNRIRVNADGGLHSCLFAAEQTSLRRSLARADQAALVAQLRASVWKKPAAHHLHASDPGLIQELAQIGG